MATTAIERLPQVKPARSHLPFILAIAIVARILLALIQYHYSPPQPLRMNRDEDVAIALSIHDGHGFSSPFSFPSGPTAFLAPGYPWLLATFIRVFGTNGATSVAVVAFQIFLSVLNVALVFFIARRHFGTRTGNLAGLICALGVPMLLMPMFIWDTCISALLLTAAIAVAPSLSRRGGFMAAGAGSALAALINPSLLPALLGIFAWSARRARMLPWLGLLTFIVVLSPWPIRNYVRLHAFIPLRSNAGYELWLGNRPGSNGESPSYPLPAYHSDARRLFLAEGEVAYMREKTELATAWIASNRREFARFTALRFIRFWTGSARSHSPTLIPLSLAGIIGLALLWRRSKSLCALFALPLIIYPLPYYITHADARYQFVLDPLLAILAGFACESFFAWCARRPVPAPELIAAED